ncbi:MAG TPA: hypothetical protein VGI93_22170 [Steroidobacteraceae bacterium]|jgi:hypothetical protein
MTDPKVRRSRVFLIFVALFFFAPLGASFYLYYSHSWHPVGHVNKGVLVDPPKPLPSVALPLFGSGQTNPKFLTHKWSFVITERDKCEADCERRLYDTRQVRIALDRDTDRVQRVFIANEDCCDLNALHESHPDLILVKYADAKPLLSLLPEAADGAQRIYLVDPLGNVMMFYPPETPPKDMLEDMKRLLQLSQIG